MIIRGMGLGGVLTFLTGTFLTLRNKLPVLTCCTYFLTRFCWISSSSVVTADGARGFAASCVKDYPHKKGSRWPKSTTNKISLLRLIIFEVVCGVNPIEPLLLVLNKWMEHGNTSKNGDLCRCSTKRSTSVQKKVRLGLQLDMASQCCLVAVCGFCVATSALALKRREEEKNGWVNVALIWFGWLKIIDSYNVIFCWPVKSKIESLRRRNANFHSWVTRLPIKINVHVANILWRLLQIPAFCLLASKIRISNSSPLQGHRVNLRPCFWFMFFFNTSFMFWYVFWLLLIFLIVSYFSYFFAFEGPAQI